MKLALLGYGKMGKMVEVVALEKGHHIVCRLTSQTKETETLATADVCIEFSHPDCFFENLEKACAFQKNIVIGTTGWYDQLALVKEKAQKAGIGIVYAPNFSKGIHHFSSLVKQAAAALETYEVAGMEIHHKQKADSPSGTAKQLAKIVQENTRKPCAFSSVRVGDFSGTHTLVFDNPSDTITLTHTSKGRLSFAQGAVEAAEWIQGKKGVFHFYET